MKETITSVNGLFFLWVLIDLLRRDANRKILIGFACALCPIIAVPIYRATRPLFVHETRTGGLAWNILREFVLVTFLLSIAFLAYGSLPNMGSLYWTFNEDLQVGVGLGILWLVALIPAALFGFILRDPSKIEHGTVDPNSVGKKSLSPKKIASLEARRVTLQQDLAALEKDLAEWQAYLSRAEAAGEQDHVLDGARLEISAIEKKASKIRADLDKLSDQLAA